MKALFLRGLLVAAALSVGLLVGPSETRLGMTLGSQALAQAECEPAVYARADGRQLATVSRNEQQAYKKWCVDAVARDTQTAATTSRSATSNLAAAGGGGIEIWCPPGALNCWCYHGTHYNGCSNFAAHCTSGLTCGPGGHICHCTANEP